MSSSTVGPRELLRESHARSAFNVAGEAWIPVRMLDGTVATLSLADTFLRAVEIADTADPDPISNAALRRLLIVLTAQLVRLSGAGKDVWNNRLRERSGFPAADVDLLLADQADYLWLFHPKSPFLQDIRLVDALVDVDFKPVSELIPTVPGGTESAWFTKPTDTVATSGRSEAAVARLLTTRWFYALPGNSSAVCAGGETLRSQAGGAFSEGPATITHAFRIGPSLFHALLRNLTPKLVRAPGAGGQVGLAWTDPNWPQISDDRLYLASLSATSTLLVQPGTNGLVESLVRAGVPRAKQGTMQVRDFARDSDPHRLLSVRTTRTGTALKAVRIEPGQHRLRALEQIRTSALQGDQALRGVVSSGDLWLGGRAESGAEHIDFISGSKQGMAASPKWKDTSDWSSKATYLDKDSDDFKFLSDCLITCFDSKRGVLPRLDYAIRRALSEASADGSRKPADKSRIPAAGLLASATQMFLDGAGDIVERALSTPAGTEEAELRAQLFLLAQATYTIVLKPFENSPRYCEMIIRSRAHLVERNPNGPTR